MGSEGPEPGTGFGGGDIFVGGALPFGVAKVGIDSTAANWSTAVLNGGWTPDGNVTGISMMHESGTGGSPKYGLISQMPLTSVDTPVNVLDNLTYSQPRVCDFMLGLLRCRGGMKELTLVLGWQRYCEGGLLQDTFAEWNHCGAFRISACWHYGVLVPGGREACVD
jgi:hypothetical protein